MKYKDFTSDLPLHRTITFRSAEENEETTQSLGVNQKVRQLGRGKFRADLAVEGTEHADLFADRFNKAVSVYLEPPAGTVGFLIWQGADLPGISEGAELIHQDRAYTSPIWYTP